MGLYYSTEKYKSHAYEINKYEVQVENHNIYNRMCK